jgi:hypothetical protein
MSYKSTTSLPATDSDALLHDPVSGFGKQTVNSIQAGIDPQCGFQAGRLRSRILQQGLDALFESQFPDMERPRAVEDAAIGQLQRFDRFKHGLDRSPKLPVLQGAVLKRNRIGADTEQQRAEFVVKVSRNVAALIVLQRDDFSQQAAIVLAEAAKRAREFIGLFGSPAYLRRS